MEELKRFYEENGYGVRRGLFAPDEIERMIAHYMKLNAQGSHPGDFPGVARRTDSDRPDPLRKYPRLIQMHEYDRETQRWMSDPRLTETIAALIGQPPRLIQTMLYYKPPGSRGQSFHQDNLYLRTEPICAAWVALDPADAQNGAMQMVPGTHRMGLLPPEPADTDLSFTDSQSQLPQDRTRVVIDMGPGDALFFGGYTAHGSMPNTTSDRFRRAFICHYEGIDAKRIVGPSLPTVEHS